MMRGGICFALLLLVSIAARAETNCVDPSSLAGSAVSITRYLDNQERDAKSDVIGIQGTGWFQSTNTIVTVEHVALAMKLSKEAWKQLTVQSSSGTLSISARIRQVIGDSKEKLAVLELQSPVPSARTATVRSLPLEPEERLLTIAYPRHEPRSVSGRFVRYATEVPLSGAALLELFDGDDRFAVDHGASGAPVFDCEGRVAAVISTVISQTLRSPFGVMRISTPWGTPNVLSVPINSAELSQIN